MDDNREGCFPESYVQPADAVSTDESMMPPPAPNEVNMAAEEAVLVLTLLLVYRAATEVSHNKATCINDT